MQHPNPAKCRELGNIFLELHKADDTRVVEMMEGGLREDSRDFCGTQACHAGWFAFQQDIKQSNGEIHYMDGANAMASFVDAPVTRKNKHPYMGDLEQWARKNPLIWGNEFGECMFVDGDAFGVNGDRLTLDVIGRHWLAVADRIEKEAAKC